MPVPPPVPPTTPTTPPAPPQPSAPRPTPSQAPKAPVKKRSNKAIPWIIGGIVLLILAGIAAILLIVFAGWKAFDKYSDTREKIEEIDEFADQGSSDDFTAVDEIDFEPVPAEIIDETETPADDIVPDSGIPAEHAWYASLAPGMYRLNATLYDPDKPEKKYKCHVDFRYNGAGNALSGCKYVNDSYGGEFNVSGTYDSGRLTFRGHEGSNNFDIDTNWLSGNRFAGTSTYGTTTIVAEATLSPL